MKFLSFLVSSLLTFSCESFKYHLLPQPRPFFPFTASNIEKWEHFQEEKGKDIVLSVSSMLPKFDTMGHKILSANHNFIQDVLFCFIFCDIIYFRTTKGGLCKRSRIHELDCNSR